MRNPAGSLLDVDERAATGCSAWRRFASGLAAVWASQIITTVGNLAVVPVYFARWTAVRYGEWLALSSVVSYLAALDMGMNMAGGNRLMQEYARGDLREYRRYQHSAMAFYCGVAAAGSVLLLIIVRYAPIVRWLGFTAAQPGEAATVSLLLGLQILWMMPAGFVMATYRTTGDLARSQWVRNAQALASLGFGAVLLLVGGGMVAMASCQLICLSIATAIVLLHLRRKHPDVMPGVAGAEMGAVRELIGPSLLFGLITLAQAVATQAPIILISSQLGSTAVAAFVTCRTLAYAARQIPTMVAMALWPQVTTLDARSEHSVLRVLHRVWVMGGSALCVSIAGALWFEGTEVVRIWTRGKIEGNEMLLRLLLLQVALQAPWLASSLFPAASNQHKTLSYAYAGSSVIGFVVAAALIGRVGLLSIPLGGLLGELLMCYHFVLRDACARIREPYWRFAGQQWGYLAGLCGVGLMAGWGVHCVAHGPAVLRWLEVASATTIGSLALFWQVGLRATDRALLKTGCRSLLGTKGFGVTSHTIRCNGEIR